MGWVWIFVLASAGYHTWCLRSGRLRFVFSNGVARRSGWLYRSENPPLYWITWLSGVGATASCILYYLMAP